MIFKGVDVCCPHCKGELVEPGEGSFACLSCERSYPVVLGIPDLRVFPDPYIDMESDREKGRTIAQQFDKLTFTELVDYYYSITPKVPRQHAILYTRGIMAGLPKAKAALNCWEGLVGGPAAKSLLEVGCGTAPLLVAGASRVPTIVGVDIAFRWLVIGRKRLAEAGLDIPLICACAEALPFNDDTFDRVVADSVLEHLQDSQSALEECNRVMASGGYVFVSTPNRFSLGPDPQVGIWGGGYLPDWFVKWRVRRQGGIPPKRRLLSGGRLHDLIASSGFSSARLTVPELTPEHRSKFKGVLHLAIGLYAFLTKVPGARNLLRCIGPWLLLVARKDTKTVVTAKRDAVFGHLGPAGHGSSR